MNTVNQTRKAIILTWRKLRGPPPIPIELLLIGEDYPNSNTYFYRGKGNFYTTIIQSLQLRDLADFRKHNYYLIESTDFGYSSTGDLLFTDANACNAMFEHLNLSSTTKILLFGSEVQRRLFNLLQQKGFTQIYCTSFPGHGYQTQFANQIQQLKNDGIL